MNSSAFLAIHFYFHLVFPCLISIFGNKNADPLIMGGGTLVIVSAHLGEENLLCILKRPQTIESPRTVFGSFERGRLQSDSSLLFPSHTPHAPLSLSLQLIPPPPQILHQAFPPSLIQTSSFLLGVCQCTNIEWAC